MILGKAALIHYSFGSLDPEFSKLVNPQLGENQGPISTYIKRLNKLPNEFHSAGEFQNAAGMKLWNITFRCISNNSFRHYGVELWKNAAKSFGSAREYLENELEQATRMGNEQMVDKLKGALGLYDFIRPQFRGSYNHLSRAVNLPRYTHTEQVILDILTAVIQRLLGYQNKCWSDY